MDNQEFNQVLAASLAVLVCYIAVVWFVTRQQNKTSVTTANEIEEGSVEIWLEYFEQKYLDLCAIGKKITANPFDDSKFGIPSNNELPVIANALKQKGFKAWINTSYSDPKIPHHLTIEWD